MTFKIPTRGGSHNYITADGSPAKRLKNVKLADRTLFLFQTPGHGMYLVSEDGVRLDSHDRSADIVSSVAGGGVTPRTMYLTIVKYPGQPVRKTLNSRKCAAELMANKARDAGAFVIAAAMEFTWPEQFD